MLEVMRIICDYLQYQLRDADYTWTVLKCVCVDEYKLTWTSMALTFLLVTVRLEKNKVTNYIIDILFHSVWIIIGRTITALVHSTHGNRDSTFSTAHHFVMHSSI